MKISEAAELAGLKASNVRFYERKGLLAPARKEDSRYRDYSMEDVQRIRQILLYRKMGISIDTIYLLLNEKAGVKDVLQRQQQELKQQMEDLQGAMDLCSLILAEEQQNPFFSEEKLAWYLSYVHQEEQKGRHFAEAEELLEDIAGFTGTDVLHSDPAAVWLFQWPWLAKLLSVGFWGIYITVAGMHLAALLTGKTSLNHVWLVFMLVFPLVLYGTGFAAYRRKRNRYQEDKK